MNEGKEPKSVLKSINRRKFLIWLGIFLGIILVGISLLKQMAIRTINRFRIRSVEQTPSFDPNTWNLAIGGLVDRPLTIGYNDLLKLKSEEQLSDFHCVEGWSVDNVKWRGVRLKTIFDMVGLKPEATSVSFHSESGIYLDSLTIKEALEPEVMLAYMLNDEPLPGEQGMPLRLVMPRMFGYKSVKWVNRITLTAAQEVGYWEAQGYNMDGVTYP